MSETTEEESLDCRRPTRLKCEGTRQIFRFPCTVLHLHKNPENIYVAVAEMVFRTFRVRTWAEKLIARV